MLGPERLFFDRYGAFAEPPRAGKVAGLLEDECEIAEIAGGIRMVGTERLLIDGERALEPRACSRQGRLRP